MKTLHQLPFRSYMAFSTRMQERTRQAGRLHLGTPYHFRLMAIIVRLICNMEKRVAVSEAYWRRKKGE